MSEPSRNPVNNLSHLLNDVQLEDNTNRDIIRLLTDRVKNFDNQIKAALESDADASVIQELMDKQHQTKNQLSSYNKSEKNESSTVEAVVLQKKGLTVSRKDIPHFQLESDIPRLYPNEEVFESADHFLSTYEKILTSGGMELEEHWLLTFPLCLHHNYELS